MKQSSTTACGDVSVMLIDLATSRWRLTCEVCPVRLQDVQTNRREQDSLCAMIPPHSAHCDGVIVKRVSMQYN